MPHRSSVPLYWRLKKSRYSLLGSRCTKCGTAYFPRRPLCPNCRSRGNIEDFTFSGKGKVASWTIIRTAPEGFERDTPYAVAVVELDEGARLIGQLTGDIKGLGIGKMVRAVFRRQYSDGDSGLIHYGLKFELAR